MSDLIPLLRALIQDELRGLHLGELGVVTATAPHADAGDDHNYTCNLKLREGELELRRVPMCTPHVGMVSAPRIGDIVLVTYINGDANRPIVTGRLYSDEARPPVHEDKAWRVASPYDEKTSITLGADGAVQVVAGDTTLTLQKDGAVEIKGKAALEIKVQSDATVACANATINASGSIALGEGGAGVITMMSHKCYFTGAPLVGSTTVTAKG